MELLLLLDEQCRIPLYTQAVERLKQLILKGELPAGSKLPSTRELAESLGISRCTASKAYDELSRQGLICTRAASGTFVSTVLPSEPAGLPCLDIDQAQLSPARKSKLSQIARRMIFSNAIEAYDSELHPELNYSGAALDQLPSVKWRESIARAARSSPQSYEMDCFGYLRLREAIAAYLNRSRGIKCGAGQIVLFSSAQAALDLLARLFLNPGDCAVVENPGFPGARRCFALNGADLHAIPVDEQGFQSERLSSAPEHAKLVYLTPYHHDPLGVSMSTERKRKALCWANEKNAMIVEDDFDSEYRYGDKPALPLFAMDQNETVIYLSSFWKLLFPLLRLGFLVVPPSLVPLLRNARALTERDFHSVEHEALALFIEEGHLERQIRKSRTAYSKRREMLVSSLYSFLGRQFRISPASAGMHLVISFPAEFSADQIERWAEESSLPMVPSAPYYLGGLIRNEFLLPFAHLEETEIARSVEKFAQLYLKQF